MQTVKNISSLILPFLFNEKKLLKDLSVLTNTKWIPHFNTFGYTGNWKVLPLYASSGNASNIFALPNGISEIKETSV